MRAFASEVWVRVSPIEALLAATAQVQYLSSIIPGISSFIVDYFLLFWRQDPEILSLGCGVRLRLFAAYRPPAFQRTGKEMAGL
jgi:hypothetical protein